jgi:WD40 repeat protein
MSRIFISHSSLNNPAAIAIDYWLKANGLDDVFLDIDPVAGISPGERWEKALQDAADRCEAVIFLVSPAWLASQWCLDEFRLTRHLKKKPLGVVIEPVPFEKIPSEMRREWQLCDLTEGRQKDQFKPSYKGKPYKIAFSSSGLARLKIGLGKAGLAAKTFPVDLERSPYPGLKALGEGDAGIFFGRDADIVRALDELRGMREGGSKQLFVIQGASGTGKSSFLRAGLIPRLKRDDRSYLVLRVIRPEKAAVSGDNGLAASLANMAKSLGLAKSQGAITTQLTLTDGFSDILEELQTAAKTRLALSDPGARAPTIVIPIDQAEELFQPGAENEGQNFLALLAAIKSQHGGTLAIATIRSDRYEELQGAEAIAKLVQLPFNLPPIPNAYYSELIEGPARRRTAAGARLEIDPEVTHRMLQEVTGEGDALPLIAFTMHQLYKNYGNDGKLDESEYTALGGVTGSIKRAIDEACKDPNQTPAIPVDVAAQERALRRTFIPHLVRLDGPAANPLRLIAVEKRLPEDAQAFAERLVRQSIFSRSRRTDETTIEIIHEAVLRNWVPLKGWLKEEADKLKIRDTLKSAAADWEAKVRAEDFLVHAGSRLEDALQVMTDADYRNDVGEPGGVYLEACRLREKERDRKAHETIEREMAQLAEITLQQDKRRKSQRRWTALLVIAGALLAGGLLLVYLQTGQYLDTRGRLIAEASMAKGDSGGLDGSLRLALLAKAVSEGSKPSAALELSRHAISARMTTERVQLSGSSFSKLALARSLAGTRNLFTLREHESSIGSVAFSPDGKLMVTASDDKTARLWDVATGKEIAVLRGHEGPVTFAAFSPNGMLVMTASEDTTARLWDTTTSKEITPLKGHEGPVTSAAFSPDGKRVVTVSEDKTVRLWDVATGKETTMLRGHEGPVTSAAFSPDGKRVVTASKDKTARLWDTATAKEIAVLRGHDGTIWSAAFSPDGKLVVTASLDKTARLWDTATAKEIAVLRGHDGTIWSAAFSPDGKLVVTACLDNTARLWDVVAGKDVAVLRAHESGVNSAAFSPDGKLVVTASRDNTARLWDPTSGKEIAVFRGHQESVRAAVFSPDGKTLVTASEDNTVRLWDATSSKEMTVLKGHTGSVNTAAFSPDGKSVVTASDDKTARLWEASTGKEITPLKGHVNSVNSAAFSPDGKLVVTASRDKTARLWYARSGMEIAVLKGHTGSVNTAAFSPDGKSVVTASDDKTARLWEASTGKEITLLKGHENSVKSAAFSPDGKLVVTASRDKTARLWDVRSGMEIAVFKGHEGPLSSATFSPDGMRVVTSSWDETARLWDVATAKEIALLRGHQGYVTSAAFSPDGKTVVTAAHRGFAFKDNTARLWDATSVKEIAVLKGHENGVTSVAFSPDGKLVVTASWDETARLWDVSLVTKLTFDDLARQACLRILGYSAAPTADELRLVGMEDEPVVDLCSPYREPL